MIRADPSLVGEMDIGRWFEVAVPARLQRRLGARLPLGRARVQRLLRTQGWSDGAAHAAFWAGVRSAATSLEWQRLTQSSYVVLVYHRLAGDRKPGQERIDVDPARFAIHVRALRLARFRHLSPEEIVAFHTNPTGTLPARSFAITVDDGFRDCVEGLARVAGLRPQLFVCTRELGGRAHWADDEPLMDWEDVARLARRGVAVGGHGRHHRRLVGLAGKQLESEVAGSLEDLRGRLDTPAPLLAYPHGANDERTRAAAIAAGYVAAYTTMKGPNGAGRDLHRLRRISVHAADGPLAVVWKALAGTPPPWSRLRTARGKRALSVTGTAAAAGDDEHGGRAASGAPRTTRRG